MRSIWSKENFETTKVEQKNRDIDTFYLYLG